MTTFQSTYNTVSMYVYHPTYPCVSVYMYVAPSGSPRIESFVITSNTTAQLSWLPPSPLEQNGVIVDYSIELCSDRTGSCGYRTTSTNDTMYEFVGELIIIVLLQSIHVAKNQDQNRFLRKP